MKLVEHKKEEIADKEIVSDVDDANFSEKKLLRVFAVGRTFRRVNFSKCIVDECYFRNSRFIECNFTGAYIKGSNFRGAQFDGCKFIYSEWEKTYLEDRFLDSCLPSEDNLARDLVRSLRVNFSQIGNYEAVNKASSIEVKLTGKHLLDAGFSKKSYYRNTEKYKGKDRLKYVASYTLWKFLDLLWGNGESLLKVLRSSALLIVSLAFVHAHISEVDLQAAILTVIEEFWGVGSEQEVNRVIAILLLVGRYVFFGLFMAILVKRLSRR